MDGDHEDATQLFEQIPNDKRVGILRTYHHQMYRDEENFETETKNPCSRCLKYYCQKNKGAGLVISISLALIIVGILSITYGFMMPGLYKFLGKNSTYSEKVKDAESYTYHKDLFLICGIIMIVFGLLTASFGIFLPLYKDSMKKKEDVEECQRTPIIVNYELPTYHTSLQAGNYFDSDSSGLLSSCSSPSENGSFKSFFIQSN